MSDMAKPSRSELARQLRGHTELLKLGGARELPLSAAARSAGTPKAAAKPTTRATAAPTPETRPPRGEPVAIRMASPPQERKPVVVPSMGLQELKGFSSPQARELEKLAEQVRLCAGCDLCASRTQTVFGTGNPNSRLMIIGEAPGGDEDAKGIPFVGRAGKLLTDIIEKGMKYRREDVYIANVLKCRPPNNRNPEPAEIEACRGYLLRQIEVIDPEVLLAVGRYPAQWLTNSAQAIGKLRGSVYDFQGRKVVATYHPAYVLRNYTVETRKKVYDDVLTVRKLLGDAPVARG